MMNMIFVAPLLMAQASVAPPPFASAVKFSCKMMSANGKQTELVGSIDPILEATGYGSAAARITKDGSGLILKANRAMLTGSTKPPRWYQIAVPIANGREYMLQLYLFPKNQKGHAFVVEQEGGLKLGAYGTMSVGICSSDIEPLSVKK
jgi:hypothetical protein